MMRTASLMSVSRKQKGNYNLLIYRVFEFGSGRRTGRLVRCTKKPLTSVRRPYNVNCAVQQRLNADDRRRAANAIRTARAGRRAAMVHGTGSHCADPHDRPLIEKETTMYNATEQFAEFNKANVAQATKFAALAIENAEKLVKPQPGRRQDRVRAERRRRARRGPVKDVQDLMTLRAKYRRDRRANRDGLLAQPVRDSPRKRKRDTRRSPKKRVGVLHEGHRRVGRQGQQVRARPARTSAVNAFKSTVRRDDRRVRPVPEGDEASREPGRRERPRRRRERHEGRQGPQGCVSK